MTRAAEIANRAAVALALGLLSPAALVAFLVAVLAAQRQRMAVEVETELVKQLGTEPLGLWSRDMTERDTKSIETALKDLQPVLGEPDSLTRVIEAIEEDDRQRLATKAMKIHKVSHYRFIAGANACDKCLSDDGKVYPVSVHPSHHPHCNCTTEPLRNETENDR